MQRSGPRCSLITVGSLQVTRKRYNSHRSDPQLTSLHVRVVPRDSLILPSRLDFEIVYCMCGGRSGLVRDRQRVLLDRNQVSGVACSRIWQGSERVVKPDERVQEWGVPHSPPEEDPCSSPGENTQAYWSSGREVEFGNSGASLWGQPLPLSEGLNIVCVAPRDVCP